MCAAPRFVPTLTEVVRPSRAETAALAGLDRPQPPTLVAPAPLSVSPPAATGASGAAGVPTPVPFSPVGADPAEAGPDPDALVTWIEAEVGDTLRRNLHDLIATALVEQIDVVAARLREDIEPMVRRAVLEAVANESASRRPD